MKDIKTVIIHDQCKEYYEAFAKKDWFAVGIWYIPPTYRRVEDILADMKSQQLIDSFEREHERINSTDPELLRIEIEMKYRKEKPEIKKKSFLEYLFGI